MIIQIISIIVGIIIFLLFRHAIISLINKERDRRIDKELSKHGILGTIGNVFFRGIIEGIANNIVKETLGLWYYVLCYIIPFIIGIIAKKVTMILLNKVF